MPASLRDMRVVSPAVNLPGLQFTAVLDATREAMKPAGPGAGDTGLPRELERSPSRYGLQAICGTASAAVIELQ